VLFGIHKKKKKKERERERMTWEMEMKVKVLKRMQSSDSGIQCVSKAEFHKRRLDNVGHAFLFPLFALLFLLLLPFLFCPFLNIIFLLFSSFSPMPSSYSTCPFIGPILL
jgi:hypothetical protein